MTENLEPREQRMADLCAQLVALKDYREAYCYCHGDEFVIAAWGRQPTDVFGFTESAAANMCIAKVYKHSPQHKQGVWVRTHFSDAYLDDEHSSLSRLVRLVMQHVVRAEEAGPPPCCHN